MNRLGQHIFVISSFHVWCKLTNVQLNVFSDYIYILTISKKLYEYIIYKLSDVQLNEFIKELKKLCIVSRNLLIISRKLYETM